MRIERYKTEYADEWNKFVDGSKNGTFLFNRGYMDYHSDRFKDHSLMFYNDRNRLVALLPANESGRTYYSHQGLTYGGYVLAPDIHGEEVIEIFELTLNYLRAKGFKEYYYKQIPSPYHLIPSQEEDYALWKNNAELIACGLSSSIRIDGRVPQTNNVSRKKIRYDWRKLSRNGYNVVHDADINSFWPILEKNLRERHNVSPTHSLEEILMLKEHFPKNIVCYVATNNRNEPESGAILYLSSQVVHVQYMSPSENGRNTGALDYLINELVDYYSSLNGFQYFDFGISTEQNGSVLNEGLLKQKERMGGRGTVYKTWRINI